MLDPNNCKNGEEQYEQYTSSTNKKNYIQYDYRDKDGKLFSVVRKNLNECRVARDEWLSIGQEDNIKLKIYTKGKNVLVLEGIADSNYKNEDSFPKGNIIGMVVPGKEHIKITKEAKQLFKDIVSQAEKTGDDVSCLDIHRYRENDVCISYLGYLKTEIDITKLDGFWIGTGEGYPDLSLLDELKEFSNDKERAYQKEDKDTIDMEE